MKKLIYAVSVCFISLSLMNCQTLNTVGAAGTRVVHTGVGFVSATGNMVGKTVTSGVNYVTGKPKTYKKSYQ